MDEVPTHHRTQFCPFSHTQDASQPIAHVFGLGGNQEETPEVQGDHALHTHRAGKEISGGCGSLAAKMLGY